MKTLFVILSLCVASPALADFSGPNDNQLTGGYNWLGYDGGGWIDF